MELKHIWRRVAFIVLAMWAAAAYGCGPARAADEQASPAQAADPEAEATAQGGRAQPVWEFGQPAEWPFVVTGTLTDAAGKPMEGVEVTAATGWATLFQHGRATSGADGRYTLRFEPGGRTPVAPDDPWGIGLQAAVISARKPGYYELELSRGGYLAMAWCKGSAQRSAWGSYRKYEGVVLADAPYNLDFVMLPAAIVDGRLLDKRGQPLPDKRLQVWGNELPPAANVRASLVTGEDGRFSVDVPCKPYWFVFPGKHRKDDLESQVFDFAVPGNYEIILTYDKPFLGRATFSAKLTAGPASGPQP